MEETGKELKIGNFTGIIDDYENEHGEIALMYREPRGSITHPHRDETITLGTLMVEQYERPAWSFNKLLYIEKEGAQEALKQDRWLERHDCAVMSSKGFSTRAARDLIDKLVEHDEPIEVFCAHDADASGTMIYQTLQEATRARGARKIKIVNIGLEPWEAVEMGLEVETIEEKDRRKPVADYDRRVRRRSRDWDEWLQTHRVELNAMTTPQLIAWLDDKMEALRRRQADPAGRGAGRGSDATDREAVARRNHRAHPPRGGPGRPGRRGHGGARPAGRRGARPAKSSNCSRTSRTPNGAIMSRRSPRSYLKKFTPRFSASAGSFHISSLPRDTLTTPSTPPRWAKHTCCALKMLDNLPRDTMRDTYAQPVTEPADAA